MAFENYSLDQLAREYYASRLASASSGVIGGSGSEVTVTNDPINTLTGRMFSKAPAPGYSLWLDTADVTYIYIAEAPTADGGTAVTFRGIRVTKDAKGNPLGKVQAASDFAWDSRGTATWL